MSRSPFHLYHPVRRGDGSDVPQLRGAIAVIEALLLTTGCMFRTVGRQQGEIERFARISGTVTTANPATGSLVVALIRFDLERPTLVDHWVYGLPYDHAAIPHAAETSSLLGEILTRSVRAD